MSRLFAITVIATWVAVSLTGEAGAQAVPSAALLESPPDASAYPTVVTRLGVVDPLGRPLTDVAVADVIAADESGQLTVEAVAVADSPESGVAWLLLVDVSGSMAETRPDGIAYLDAARSVARGFAAAAGPNDVIRLVSFAEETTSLTPWLAPTDPAIESAIASLIAPPGKTSLSRGLSEASVMAANPPPEFQRRAVVLVTDMDTRDRDPSLTLDAIRGQLTAPIHAFSLRQPVDADAELGLFLTDLTAYTGGSYGLVTATDDLAPRFVAVTADLHRSWAVTLEAPHLPDAAEHPLEIAILSAGVEVGRIATEYTSGSLFDVSPLAVTGLVTGDEVSDDVDLRAEIDADQWSSVRMEVFRDCQPGTCEPVHQVETSILEYRLLAGALEQGDHTLTIRATVKDADGREFSESRAVPFTRAGTTLNYGALVLIGGIGLAGVAGTALAMRRRGRGAV